MNELLLILSLIFEFSMVLLAYKFFGKVGLFVMSAVYAICANIEVMIIIEAFGLQQTLGNILFAASFLITDILSENESEKDAQTAVNLGIFVSVLFMIISQSWLLYIPSESDFIMPSIKSVFSNTPRIMIASLSVYAITQRLDVWLYHKWWRYTEKKYNDKKAFLWLRNNFSTLISQLLNTVLFNFAAFYKVYPMDTLINICSCGYIIYIATSLLDTPFVYLSRKINKKKI